MERLALVVAYDGTHYAGFQRQGKGEDTIQVRLEAALTAVAGVPVPVRAAGRTDAGVHALGQVVDCPWPARVPAERVPPAVNRHLPPDVAVLAAKPVPPGFHARYTAVSKRYRYVIWRAPGPSPFWRRYAWHTGWKLDVAAMAEAAQRLVGRHDFRAFSAAGRPVRSAVRHVFTCEVRELGPLLFVIVEADGFLYRMVRRIVGTLVEVGRGFLAPGDIDAALASGEKSRAGPTAPPHGLFLEWVRYPAGEGPELPPPCGFFLDSMAFMP